MKLLVGGSTGATLGAVAAMFGRCHAEDAGIGASLLGGSGSAKENKEAMHRSVCLADATSLAEGVGLNSWFPVAQTVQDTLKIIFCVKIEADPAS